VFALALTREDTALRNAQFTACYQEVHDRAWRLALYLCGRREDAEDLLAESVAQAIRSFDRLRDQSRFPWWFMKLMRNLHIDHIRRRKRQLDTADYGGDVLVWERLGRYPTISGPARNLQAREVFRALDRLPEGLRTPLALHALDGYSVKEIADILGLGQSAVKVRIHRARKRLMEFLGEGWTAE
jgi:RNA polymerase sigma-70 factor (ECF subfamily)